MVTASRFSERSVPGGAGWSVLLVEDDKELASLMTQFLEQRGFTVEVASDGREGLA